jgi:hypothetical protein
MEPFEELVMSESPDPGPDRPEPGGAANVEAVFTLESAAVCPACGGSIDTIGIVRLLRTRVNFVSSLPRRGQLMICPQCRTVLGGSLGGLV